MELEVANYAIIGFFFQPHFVKADNNLISMVISMDAILRVECFIASADQI